jgi:hypothetical protein
MALVLLLLLLDLCRGMIMRFLLRAWGVSGKTGGLVLVFFSGLVHTRHRWMGKERSGFD